jgi:predicted  nucleic acid-binding Zn-ribbon protein
MPHSCVRCSRIIPAGSREILEGCKECHSHFFFYIKDEQLKNIKERIVDIPEDQKEQVEEDIREMVGVEDEMTPVILDVESIRVTGEGKFELDIAKIFRKDLPLIYKLEEGKYIIDLASTLKGSVKDLIKNPDKRVEKIKRNRKNKK